MSNWVEFNCRCERPSNRPFGVSNGLAARAADDGAISDLRRRAGGPRSRAVAGDRRGAAGYQAEPPISQPPSLGPLMLAAVAVGGLGVSTAGAGAIALCPRQQPEHSAPSSPQCKSCDPPCPRGQYCSGGVCVSNAETPRRRGSAWRSAWGPMVPPGWVDRSAVRPSTPRPAQYRHVKSAQQKLSPNSGACARLTETTGFQRDRPKQGGPLFAEPDDFSPEYQRPCHRRRPRRYLPLRTSGLESDFFYDRQRQSRAGNSQSLPLDWLRRRAPRFYLSLHRG